MRNQAPLGLCAVLLFFAPFASAQSTPPAPPSAAPPAAPSAAPASPSPAKPDPAASYAADKAFAVGLLKQQHNLEALPIFRDLAQRNPADPEVLLGFAICLVSHAATLPDTSAATDERLQARALLERAKELGNSSTILLNLLDSISLDGTVSFGGSPEYAQAMADGEAAFAKADYKEAITHYSRAFELDPKSSSATLFIGDSYFSLKDYPNAAVWYDKSIALDPDRETPYRYESDMYTRMGNSALARTRAIQAVVAEPYAQISWRGLLQWAQANKLQLNRVQLNLHTQVSKDDPSKINITIDPGAPTEQLMVAIAYNGTRVSWQKDEFKKNFPKEDTYRHSLAEEVAALTAAADTLKSMKPAALAKNPDLNLLKQLAAADMLAPYVLLSAPDRGIAADYEAYRAQNRAKLEAYLSTYVVPPAPAK